MTHEVLHVQYGCGWDAPEDWLNFDASPTLRIERFPIFGMWLSRKIKSNTVPFPRNACFGDIVRGLPVPDQSCKGVYCSHILEHLCLADLRNALINTYRILSPEGIFRLVVPDLRFYVVQYTSRISPESAMEFMLATGLGEETRQRGIKGVAFEMLSNSKHRWMWDYESLKNELELIGFSSIRRAVYGDSQDSMFRSVERKERWDNCLGMECIK